MDIFFPFQIQIQKKKRKKKVWRLFTYSPFWCPLPQRSDVMFSLSRYKSKGRQIPPLHPIYIHTHTHTFFLLLLHMVRSFSRVRPAIFVDNQKRAHNKQISHTHNVHTHTYGAFFSLFLSPPPFPCSTV